MSQLNVNNINGVDVQNLASQTARAWACFNGTGAVTIRKAYNVDSITDNGTGNYTLNFSAALPDSNYSVAGSVLGVGAVPRGFWVAAANDAGPETEKTQFAVRVNTGATASTALTDNGGVSVQIFG